MNKSRVTVTLSTREMAALMQCAQSEFRSPKEQIRYLLRQALITRGLLEGPRILTADQILTGDFDDDDD